MLRLEGIDDIQTLKEDCEVECKLAQGKSGEGKLPDSFWETYSAFANTSGGVVFLGLKEVKGSFEVAGIKNTSAVKQDLFNKLQNSQVVNCNLLNEDDVSIHTIDGCKVIAVSIPQANWSQKPVYIKDNISKTYKRLNEGDYKCDEQEIKHLMGEASSEPHDSKLLVGYGLDDINSDTLRSYRQQMSNLKPQHIANTQDSIEFLTTIGAWKRDRESGKSGLTIAGLLMFGKLSSIQEALPHYALDYLERPRAITENRWNYRLYTDGSWSGNLFDFYNKVYAKLTEDIKVPFSIENGQRTENSLVAIALREALANVLCHADYRSNRSIMIVKRPDMFGFRNPGRMRLSLESAKDGGHSLCRNPKIHQMFLHVGACERAGTGIPTIYSNWGEEGYRVPLLHENPEDDTTLLELRLATLLPVEVVKELESSLPEFNSLTQLEKTILVTAKVEQIVTHKRICEISSKHSRDITDALQKLISRDLLCKTSHKSYMLPDTDYTSVDDFYGGDSVSGVDSGYKELNSGHKELDSGCNTEYDRDDMGRIIHQDLDLPIINNLDDLSPEFKGELSSFCALPLSKRRLNYDEWVEVILAVCNGHYITLSCISELVDRNTDTLRKSYLTKMKDAGLLKLAFPAEPNDPRQGYAKK